jgi:Legume-like lectin family
MLSQTVTLPTSAYVGFTGGTGGLTDRHAIAKLITAANGP